jgi:ribosomal protein S18 acetylase RimI-like enzyme
LNIEKSTNAQAEWLDGIIKREFPYTEFTPKKIEERMNDSKYIILIAKQSNIETGFAEMELFLDKKEARLNAIYVEDGWRDQGVGTMLVEHCINECKHKKIQRLFLLVKSDNVGAKHLYEKLEFEFEKMHNKIIDASKVEVWAKSV